MVACAALAGRPMHIPMLMARVLIVLIGASLGSVVTPETLHGLSDYPLSIGAVLSATIVMSIAGTGYLRFAHKFDRTTAYLAAVPGGMAQVMVLAMEHKADLRAVAIVQTTRVIILAIALPAAFAAFGLANNPQATARRIFHMSQFGELIILMMISTVAAVAAHRIKFPGGLLFGAMLASAALHGSGLVEVAMPSQLQNGVMIAFGAVGGARFANTPLSQLRRYFGAALGSFLLATMIAVGFASLLLSTLSIPAAQVIVAFAPGASDGMMLLALALHFDPIYVGSHHLVRIFFVMAVTPLVLRFRKPTI